MESFVIMKGTWMVELTHIGEGWSGEYDPNDPNDDPLIRFYVSRYNESQAEWEDIADGSYCTAMTIDASREKLEAFAWQIMSAFGDKRRLQELSWSS